MTCFQVSVVLRFSFSIMDRFSDGILASTFMGNRKSCAKFLVLDAGTCYRWKAKGANRKCFLKISIAQRKGAGCVKMFRQRQVSEGGYRWMKFIDPSHVYCFGKNKCPTFVSVLFCCSVTWLWGVYECILIHVCNFPGGSALHIKTSMVNYTFKQIWSYLWPQNSQRKLEL